MKMLMMGDENSTENFIETWIYRGIQIENTT